MLYSGTKFSTLAKGINSSILLVCYFRKKGLELISQNIPTATAGATATGTPPGPATTRAGLGPATGSGAYPATGNTPAGSPATGSLIG